MRIHLGVFQSLLIDFAYELITHATFKDKRIILPEEEVIYLANKYLGKIIKEEIQEQEKHEREEVN